MVKIELDKRLSVFENAKIYFDKAKKLKEKIDRLEKIIEETKKKLEDIDKEIKIKEKKIKKERKWYEKFRWFFTSNNFLLIAGKDALTNEILIKKYLEKDDLVFHADIHGSPFGILKDGINAKEEDILEAAKFVGSYSKAWKQKLSYIEVYYVYPNQVSKKAPSGEYLPRGSFMIYGKKNYIRVNLEVAIGVDENYNIVPGVPESVKEKAIRYFTLIPGNKKVLDIAKYIARELELDISDVSKFIPGESEIKEYRKVKKI